MISPALSALLRSAGFALTHWHTWSCFELTPPLLGCATGVDAVIVEKLKEIDGSREGNANGGSKAVAKAAQVLLANKPWADEGEATVGKGGKDSKAKSSPTKSSRAQSAEAKGGLKSGDGKQANNAPAKKKAPTARTASAPQKRGTNVADASSKSEGKGAGLTSSRSSARKVSPPRGSPNVKSVPSSSLT